jgi:hypothetical protein
LGVYDLTIYSIIERNAGVHADQVGWVSDNEEGTHLQFLKRVNRVAKYIVLLLNCQKPIKA